MRRRSARLIGRFPDRGRLRVCYEAGPTGFGLHRLLHSMGVACEVVAPSLIPKAPGDRVKTDRRDCRRLARLHRAGELVAIRVPTEAEEAVRDLCRARADLVGDRTRTRHRLSKFLLRHDRIWRGGTAWTVKHEQWLAGQRFDDAALRATYGHYRAMLAARDAELDRDRGRPGPLVRPRPVRRRGDPAGRLPRGGAAGRVDDRQRGRRLAAVPGRAARSWASPGWCPSRVLLRRACPPWTHHQGRQRPPAHPADRVGLGLPAPAQPRRRPCAAASNSVTRPPRPGPGPPNNACAPGSGGSSARKTSRNVVAVAIARELAGFLWAEMTTAN